MNERVSGRQLQRNVTDEASAPAAIRILQVAGGDLAFADALRQMIWNAYQEAGCPLGPGEKAMFSWWEAND